VREVAGIQPAAGIGAAVRLHRLTGSAFAAGYTRVGAKRAKLQCKALLCLWRLRLAARGEVVPQSAAEKRLEKWHIK
jgi:hypothetical protein